jgi:hypothetical protein
MQFRPCIRLRVIGLLPAGICLLLWSVGSSVEVTLPLAVNYSPTNFLRFETNGPAVFSVLSYARTNVMPSMWASRPPPPAALPRDVRERWMMQNTQTVAQVWDFTNRAFDYFQPSSFDQFLWTNFIAHTNGRSTLIWSQRAHPPGWPAVPPVVQWNTNCLMWGMKGMTALSPCWESEGNPGQVPITALTRRHGYTRGHDMGPDGFNTNRTGMRVWFLTTNNQAVEVKARLEVTRTFPKAHRDYTIVLFDRDLPASIQPIRVVGFTNQPPLFELVRDAPCPFFQTEQTGHVSAQVPGFTVNILKGGDSGSPNMLPLPGELVFSSGRSSSGPSSEMQADMDELCRREGLDPQRYQMQWAELSSVWRAHAAR